MSFDDNTLMFMRIKKRLFRVVAKINKLLIPSMSNKDFNKLTNLDKLIIAYRYWITKNSL